MGSTRDAESAFYAAEVGNLGSTADVKAAFFNKYPQGLIKSRNANTGAVLRTKVSTEQDCVWTHIGDSTANGNDEWLYLALDQWRADFPTMRVTHEVWDINTHSYMAPTTLQDGVQFDIPAPIVKDTFSTDSATLSGRVSETGQVWSSGGGAVSGGVYNATNATAGIITHGIDPTLADGIRVAARVTTPVGGATINRILPFAVGGDELFAEVLPGAANLSVSLYTRIAGVATGQSTSFAGVDNSASRVVDVVVTVRGLTATATFTYNGQIRTASRTLPAGWNAFTGRALQLAVGNAPAATFDNIEVGLNGKDPKTLRVVNGSASGQGITYFLSRLDTLAPVNSDLFTIATSHNHGTQTVSDFLTQYDSLVTAIRVKYPTAGITVVSQNPQFSPKPADQAAAHNLRIKALRGYAEDRGFGYIPAVEKFISRSDRGQAWVSADGIHPDTVNGFPAWRDAALKFLRNN